MHPRASISTPPYGHDCQRDLTGLHELVRQGARSLSPAKRQVMETLNGGSGEKLQFITIPTISTTRTFAFSLLNRLFQNLKRKRSPLQATSVLTKLTSEASSGLLDVDAALSPDSSPEIMNHLSYLNPVVGVALRTVQRDPKASLLLVTYPASKVTESALTHTIFPVLKPSTGFMTFLFCLLFFQSVQLVLSCSFDRLSTEGAFPGGPEFPSQSRV